MNLMRSPTKTASMSATGSQPDLNKYEYDEFLKQVTLRKRKQPEEYKVQEEVESIRDQVDSIHKELTDFRTEITSLLAEFVTAQKSQTQKVDKISDDVSTIKQQVNDVNSTLNSIIKDQQDLKTEVANLNKQSDVTRDKIKAIETDIGSLKNGDTTRISSDFLCNEVIQESQERSIRSKNIILIGVPEPEVGSPETRRGSDKTKALNILTPILKNSADLVYTYRLGKYAPGKTRHMKLCFSSQDCAKNILRNKNKITDITVKLFSDSTPNQQKHLKLLKEELNRRTQCGEKNLTIKYVKGIPKIIELVPKNL